MGPFGRSRPGPLVFYARMRDYLNLVTFSHTVFALPFALLGYTLAITRPDAAFSWWTLLLVVGCMIFARSAAMAFNRLVDARIDARNERTAVREIPAGIISPRQALAFVGVNSGLFVGCAGLLNPLCFYLSPIALLVVLGYSFTKRYTWLCHVVLGVGLALAPIGAYLAVSAEFEVLPVALGGVVLLWVAGFDVIYALQDEDFDVAEGLSSVPSRFGSVRALWISRLLHLGSASLLIWCTVLLLGLYPGARVYIFSGTIVFVAALIYQQFIVRANDLSRVDRAFFTTNGAVSGIYAALVILGIVLQTNVVHLQ